ncbi:MAG TPA: lysophospholipid acyltransferase family protein [Intrasporangium sp.]|nr:lysophospholipid acyltransferase family protein [Intrasporangium sp.]
MLYSLSRGVLVPLSRALYRPTIIGAENVPRSGAVILASNHLSFIDSFAIPLASPRQVRFLAKEEYWTATGLGGRLRKGFFDAVGMVPVNRHSATAAQESLDKGLEVLRAGDAFGIYPEGTRSRDGRLYRGHTGLAWLALNAAVPVVPVGLIGTDKIQPVGARFPTLAKVTVKFGTMIPIEAYQGLPPGKARRQLTDDVMEAIAGLTGQERAPGYNEVPNHQGP